MSEIPWSKEGEETLRKEIARARFEAAEICMAAAITVGMSVFLHWWFMFAAVVFVVLTIKAAERLFAARDRLGWEEGIAQGVRIPGSGMLANKPKDTSRLTRWIAHQARLGVETFDCPCGRAHLFAEMEWIPNNPELAALEHLGSVEAAEAFDRGGGRYVLHCACGIGHFVALR